MLDISASLPDLPFWSCAILAAWERHQALRALFGREGTTGSATLPTSPKHLLLPVAFSERWHLGRIDRIEIVTSQIRRKFSKPRERRERNRWPNLSTHSCLSGRYLEEYAARLLTHPERGP